MKTYWDYTQKERSEMTEEQVKGMLDVELMEKGVLKVVAPELRPVENTDVKRKIYYQVGGITFETSENAHAFLALCPLNANYDYNGGGYDYKYAEPIIAEVGQVSLCLKQDVKNLKAVLAKNREAKEANDNASRKYEKDCEAQNKVLQGVWENWYECQELGRTYQTVIATKNEYLKLAGGDEEIAKTFLLKVFAETAVKDAEDWFAGRGE